MHQSQEPVKARKTVTKKDFHMTERISEKLNTFSMQLRMPSSLILFPPSSVT
jgi:hypothetical protein